MTVFFTFYGEDLFQGSPKMLSLIKEKTGLKGQKKDIL